MRTRQHNALAYRVELGVIRLRDLFRPPSHVLIEAGVRAGMTVLDFGCGPGGFSLAAATIVGLHGRVLSVDVQPIALATVRCRAARLGLGNVDCLRGDQIADVPAVSVDMALLYDVLHIGLDSEWRQTVLTSIERVLKPAGLLSVRDHHLGTSSLAGTVTRDGPFDHLSDMQWSSLFGKRGCRPSCEAS
jgi:ubiquinone/menaquinone biosynthesis C-methylase UbiE